MNHLRVAAWFALSLMVSGITGTLLPAACRAAEVQPPASPGKGIESPSLSRATSAEPVNRKLSPEASELLDYLASVYGRKVLTGQQGSDNVERAFKASGLYPAILGEDLCGWSKRRWDEVYKRNQQHALDRLKSWRKAGGIVSLSWHWPNPMGEGGDFVHTQPEGAARPDVGKMVTPGTAEHRAMMEDLRKHADSLQQLCDARIPVLWRPLHEIEGGWFWWTDYRTPENTAELWRIMFDYLTRQRKLNNLIWVYSAALAADKGKEGCVAIERRKRFYPGQAYVDIAGIDIYPNPWWGWKDYRDDTYQKAFDIMSQVAPQKMLALCECQGFPPPELLAKQGPRWLYCLPWWVGKDNKHNPPEWIKSVYPHGLLITRDKLPPWVSAEANTPVYAKVILQADKPVTPQHLLEPWIAKDMAGRGKADFAAMSNWVRVGDKAADGHVTTIWDGNIEGHTPCCPAWAQVVRADGRRQRDGRYRRL